MEQTTYQKLQFDTGTTDGDGNPILAEYQIKAGQPVYIDLADPANAAKEYLLYALDGRTFTAIGGYYARYDGDSKNYLVIDLNATYPVEKDGGGALTGTAQAYTYTWETGNHYLTYGDGSRMIDKAGRVFYFEDMQRTSYATRADLEDGKLVLRPGSVEEDGSLLLIIGPLSDIPIREVDIPANAMTDASGSPITKGYRITDTLFLTRGGLVLNIKGAFSAKFDGETYTSVNLVARALGSLGQKRDLAYNDEGKIVYGGRVYTLYNNTLSYVDASGKIITLDRDASMDILYEVRPVENEDGPSITFLGGQQIMLEQQRIWPAIITTWTARPG